MDWGSGGNEFTFEFSLISLKLNKMHQVCLLSMSPAQVIYERHRCYRWSKCRTWDGRQYGPGILFIVMLLKKSWINISKLPGEEKTQFLGPRLCTSCFQGAITPSTNAILTYMFSSADSIVLHGWNRCMCLSLSTTSIPWYLTSHSIVTSRSRTGVSYLVCLSGTYAFYLTPDYHSVVSDVSFCRCF